MGKKIIAYIPITVPTPIQGGGISPTSLGQQFDAFLTERIDHRDRARFSWQKTPVNKAGVIKFPKTPIDIRNARPIEVSLYL